MNDKIDIMNRMEQFGTNNSLDCCKDPNCEVCEGKGYITPKSVQIKTSVNRINGSWIAGYFNKEGVNSYIEDAKTKDELIHKLILKILKLKEVHQ